MGVEGSVVETEARTCGELFIAWDDDVRLMNQDSQYDDPKVPNNVAPRPWFGCRNPTRSGTLLVLSVQSIHTRGLMKKEEVPSFKP
eukprot:967028-Rhodomonas_salina.2